MSSELGKKLTVSIFGQSHGTAIGAVISGLPAGEEIDMDALYSFMERRKGGQNAATTARREKDMPRFLSGIENGKTCGFPVCAVIENGDPHSSDYEKIKNTPRPGHADLTAFLKWNGHADMRGGGHFSGRLTAPICIAGGIAKQILERKGVSIGAHLLSVKDIKDTPFDAVNPVFDEIAQKPFPVINDPAGEEMLTVIKNAHAQGDSVGGIVECAVTGLPAGLGDALFSGVEGRMSHALFGIPGVKGVEFGEGFHAAALFGSENNDEIFYDENGCIQTRTNRAGGILGGITNGMPLIVRAAFKPTPSISKAQSTINLETKTNAIIETHGRHDACIAVRAVPVVEAVCALVALDMILEGK